MSQKLTFQLLTKKNKYLRFDVLPFLGMYLGLIVWFIELEDEDDEVYPKIAFIGVVFLQCITYLMGHWSQRAKKLIQYDQIGGKKTQQNLEKAQFIMISYYPKQKSPIFNIVDLLWEEERHSQTSDKKIKSPYIHFMEKKYIFDENKQEFYRLKPNTHVSISDIKQKKEDHKINETIYDKNILEIPMKKFNDILKDQLMEPFSFFQIFSVSLWLMDENRMYAIMTLGLLFFSACTVVIQRLRTMLMLRGMKLTPSYVQVYRNNKWERISSDDLVPGDICVIQAAHNIKPVEGVVRETDEEFLKREIPMSHKLPPKFFKTENIKTDDAHKSLPCDFILLNGSCVANEAVLTGESIPQIKDSIENTEEDKNLDIKGFHKNSVLFCGTEIVQTFPNENYPSCIKVKPPNNSCLAYVVRTGFDTSKGKLIRTVMHNNENLQIKQTDALFLIAILLIFSIVSSAYVLMHGIDDEDRSKNKLFLRCILIITTVVPPELPMILTISVNTSLLYLQRKKIFCTEPFRIPFGGKIDVLAFDKTGTLTSDSLLFKGILDNLSSDIKQLKDRDQINENAQHVLAGCHSLITAEKKLTGDPIETLFFENQTSWQYNTAEKTAKYKITEKIIRNHTSFAFRSDLKRMSTVVSVVTQNEKQNQVLCKGAPEVIQDLLLEVPENYENAYKYYTKLGYRVLTLAYKLIPIGTDLSQYKREHAEKDLMFAGLIICESPLKHDTARQIKKLQESAFTIIMITGDNILTAISIGKKLKLGQSEKNTAQNYVTIEQKNENEFVYIDQNDKELSFSDKQKDLENIKNDYIVCISGPALKQILLKYNGKQLSNILSTISIFARTTPQQKETIIYIQRQNKLHVLMCGDGTNDVGALKKADLGIALVGMKEENPQEIKERKIRKKEIEAKKMKDPRKYMQEMSLFEGEVNYKFGDACIAAPFTSKNSASIRCVNIILRQGICTLVTTIQTYKILTISSLIQAYSLSVLHMEALKFSELQYTILGMSAAYCYFQFSNSKPLKKISPLKPVGTIFEIYFIVSVIGQVFLHLYGTYESVQIGLKYSTPEDLETNNDEEFKPTFLNTSVFLFSTLSQTCSFLFNNGGEPHMEGFSKNKRFLKVLLFFLIASVVFALNIPEDLSVSLDLKFTGISYDANMELFWLFMKIIVANYLLEIGCRYMKFKKLFNWI